MTHRRLRSLAITLFLVGTASACGRSAGERGAGTAGGDTCDAVMPHLRVIYMAEAQAREPTRVEEAVADNVAMSMAQCRRQPEFAACANRATDVQQLETGCFPALDDEGSEGDRFLP